MTTIVTEEVLPNSCTEENLSTLDCDDIWNKSSINNLKIRKYSYNS